MAWDQVMRGAERAVALARLAQLCAVRCPRCNHLCAVWSPETRCLYGIAEDGYPGEALSTDWRVNVAARCEACDVTYHTSGRAVGRRFHKNLAPLA